jgi:hypothetical protein
MIAWDRWALLVGAGWFQSILHHCPGGGPILPRRHVREKLPGLGMILEDRAAPHNPENAPWGQPAVPEMSPGLGWKQQGSAGPPILGPTDISSAGPGTLPRPGPPRACPTQPSQQAKLNPGHLTQWPATRIDKPRPQGSRDASETETERRLSAKSIPPMSLGVRRNSAACFYRRFTVAAF